MLPIDAVRLSQFKCSATGANGHWSGSRQFAIRLWQVRAERGGEIGGQRVHSLSGGRLMILQDAYLRIGRPGDRRSGGALKDAIAYAAHRAAHLRDVAHRIVVRVLQVPAWFRSSS